jgi:UDP-N-acetylglucosamine 3-dehydrogenase
MIRMALVGLGEVGQHHLAGIAGSPHAELRLACDLDPELLAASGAARTTADFGDVLAATDVDAVSLCLPHDLHAPFAIRALEAGKHVLLEKPMATSVADCRAILAAASRSGREVGVSHNQTFFTPYTRARELIRSGGIGRLLQVRERLAIGGKYGAWRADPARAGGGLLFDAGVHRVYMLRDLGGEVAAVTASVDRQGAEEAFVVVAELANGALGVIDGTYNCPAGVFDDRIEVAGTEALVELAGLEAYFERFVPDGVPQLRVHRDGAWHAEDADDAWDASVRRSVGAFAAAIDAGQAPPVTGADGLAVVAVIEAAYRSAREGRRVEIDGADG